MSLNIAGIVLPYPIVQSETLGVIDSTKIQTYQDCPRRFFYEYVLGWRQEDANIHLAFGSAWHDAMEVFMKAAGKMGYIDPVIELAYSRFQATFDAAAEGNGAFGVDIGKDASNAYDALVEYAAKYNRIDSGINTMFTEIAGTVPVGLDRRTEGRVLHFKMDSVVESDDGIWSFEHKTTGKQSQSFLDKWGIIVQIGAYCHVLNVVFGDDARGVKINGAILRKPTKTGKGNEFLRIPVQKSPAMQLDWLWSVNRWLDLLEHDIQALSRCTIDDEILAAFPKNPTSCTKFGCAHPGLCSLKANPLTVADRPPPGYKTEHWDPRRGQEEASAVISVEGGVAKITERAK